MERARDRRPFSLLRASFHFGYPVGVLLFEPTIQASVAKSSCGDRARFLVEACAELLDPAAHFDRTAAARIAPSAAVGELVDAAKGFQDSEAHGFAPLLDAIERANSICRHNEVLASAFTLELQKFTDHLTALTAGVSNLGSNAGAKRSYLSARTGQLIAKASAFEGVINEPATGYQRILVAQTSAALMDQSPLTIRSAKRLQSLCMHICTFLLTQGRSPLPTATAIARAVCAASSPSQAGAAMERILLGEEENFRVAVVIDGVGTVLNAKNYGLKQLVKGRRLTWGSDAHGLEHHGADTELTRFCLRHWHTDSVEESLKGARADASVFVSSTSAWDAEGARQAALNLADAVVDLLNAEHRATNFGVKRKVLVWKVGGANCEYLAGRAAHVPRGRLMDISRSPSVSRSLRFATKASMERAGTLKVFFSWVALEYLAREGRDKPQNTVVEKIPKIIALVAVKQQVYRSWALYTRSPGASQLVRDAVTGGKGKGSISPDVWTSILTSSRSDLGGVDPTVVREYVQSSYTLTPYIAFRLQSTRELLSNGDRLATFCTEIEELARFNLQRMRYVRNQTAHSAEIEHAADSQLSVVALLMLDATFEAVPKWPGIPTVDALDRLHAKHRNLLADWRRSSRAKRRPSPRVDSLLRP